MDLVYMPEVLTYGSFRSPVYRDYEQPWNKNYFQYGKSLSNQTTRQQQEQIHQQSRANHKESCQLCKESKRRALGSYIRRRSRTSSCNEIHEEEEEEEDKIEEEEENEEIVQEATIKVEENKEEQENKKENDKSRLQNLREWKTDKFSLFHIKKSQCN